MFKMPIGLYEKALPSELSWEKHLTAAGQAGARCIPAMLPLFLSQQQKDLQMDW
jgi:L-ribulose-5-phosphate 3-epimerase UlaE